MYSVSGKCNNSFKFKINAYTHINTVHVHVIACIQYLVSVFFVVKSKSKRHYIVPLMIW